MVHCHSHTQTIPIEHQTTPALCSSSSSPLGILLGSALMLGFMELRYCPSPLARLINWQSQIFPTHARAKGINISASAGAIGSIAVGQYFPIAIDQIKSKTYFIFFSINAVSLIVSIFINHRLTVRLCWVTLLQCWDLARFLQYIFQKPKARPSKIWMTFLVNF